MFRSKKGAFILALEEQIKLILLVIIVLLVFLPLGKALYDFYLPGVDKELKNSIIALTSEAQDLKKDIQERGIENPSIIVPTYLEKDTIITAYTKDDANSEKKCKKNACFCIYQTKDEKTLSFCQPIKGITLEETREIAEGKANKLINIELNAEEKDNKILLYIT